MAKLWAGRTSGEVNAAADDFNSSIRFDSRMYRQDITGSMAHAAMLGARGIIAPAEAETLIAGLEGILKDLDSGALTFDPEAEDIHMFVEQVLTERLGDVGKKLHTARSRNDQVALDLRMYLLDECGEIDGLLREVLLDKANGFVGRTVIHPTHVKFVNALMAVTREEYDDACQILETDGGVVKGSGGNKMNEIKPHTNWAKKVYNRARAFGVIKNESGFVKLFAVNE